MDQVAGLSLNQVEDGPSNVNVYDVDEQQHEESEPPHDVAVVALGRVMLAMQALEVRWRVREAGCEERSQPLSCTQVSPPPALYAVTASDNAMVRRCSASGALLHRGVATRQMYKPKDRLRVTH